MPINVAVVARMRVRTNLPIRKIDAPVKNPRSWVVSLESDGYEIARYTGRHDVTANLIVI